MTSLPRARTQFRSTLFLYDQLANIMLGLWYDRQESSMLPCLAHNATLTRGNLKSIALVENRSDVASEQLDTLCKLAPRGAIWKTDEELRLCRHAHALYQLAWLKGPLGFAECIALPDRNNFCAPYATCLATRPGYKPSLYITFPEDLEILNRILEAPIQQQVLTYKVFSDTPHARPDLVKDEDASLQEFLKTFHMLTKKAINTTVQ